jgi:hypothetical protein
MIVMTITMLLACKEDLDIRYYKISPARLCKAVCSRQVRFFSWASFMTLVFYSSARSYKNSIIFHISFAIFPGYRTSKYLPKYREEKVVRKSWCSWRASENVKKDPAKSLRFVQFIRSHSYAATCLKQSLNVSRITHTNHRIIQSHSQFNS